LKTLWKVPALQKADDSCFSGKRAPGTKLSNLRGVFDPNGTRRHSQGRPIGSEFVTAFSHWAGRNIPGYLHHSTELCEKSGSSLDWILP
jgi:hypothetical protein